MATRVKRGAVLSRISRRLVAADAPEVWGERLNGPLQIPRRKAADMNVEDIEVAVTVSTLTRIPVLRELNLELHLILRDGSSADRARGTHAGAAP